MVALGDIRGNGPKFDWTINLGHVLTMTAFMIAMGAGYTAYQVTINDHDSRIRALEKGVVVLDGRTNEISSILYSIKQDLAIVRYRLEKDKP